MNAAHFSTIHRWPLVWHGYWLGGNCSPIPAILLPAFGAVLRSAAADSLLGKLLEFANGLLQLAHKKLASSRYFVVTSLPCHTGHTQHICNGWVKCKFKVLSSLLLLGMVDRYVFKASPLQIAKRCASLSKSIFA